MEVVVQNDLDCNDRSTVIKVIVIPIKLMEGHTNQYCLPSTCTWFFSDMSSRSGNLSLATI